MAASPVVARFEWVHSPSEFNIPAYFHWDIRNVKECYSTTSGSGAPALKATSGTIGPATNSFPVSGKSKWYCIDLKGKRFPIDPAKFIEAARIVEAPLAAPTLSKPEGTYTAGVQISVVSQQGLLYRYTQNGDEVTTDSHILLGALTLSSSATIRVRAYRPGFNPGPETKAHYTIIPPAVVAPGMSPFGGTFVGSALVTLTPSTSGAQIRYTTNNSDVTASSPLYVSPFTLTANSTVKARSFKAGMTDSAPISAYFAIRAAAPAANPDGGSHIGPVSVALKSNTELAQIRYSTNGSDVTASSTLYSVPFVLPNTATVKAKSFKSGMTDSTQTSVNFVIQPGSLQVIYLHSDALGSVIAETDANGNVIKRTEYMPFGQSKDN